VAEASNAMGFDGIICQGETLKIRRPHDYNPAVRVHHSACCMHTPRGRASLYDAC